MLVLRVCLNLALIAATSAANAGPPYLTDDPETPPLHRWEAVLFTMGTIADGAATGALPAIEFNYGGFEATQLHIKVPIGFQAGGHDETEFGGADIDLLKGHGILQPIDAVLALRALPRKDIALPLLRGLLELLHTLLTLELPLFCLQ